MQYLTFKEYTEIGGMCEETAFNRNIVRASGIITNATFGRIEKMLSVPDEVKALCRDLIEYIHNNPSTEKSISSKSQSAGGVSESESFIVKSKDEQAQDIENMVFDYLMSVKDNAGTPLLYRGCSC